MAQDLAAFLGMHTRKADRSSGAVDLVLLGLDVRGDPSPEALRAAIAAHVGVHCALDVFDGREHSFLQLGAWLGDQELALRLIGLGTVLGMWRLLTPLTIVGGHLDDTIAVRMAGSGFVSLRADLPPPPPATHSQTVAVT